ncbi:hypothetical protein BURK2_00817 [Burkholderiales bacterium]|nr:MAG: ATP-binding protein [Burkholderiales bacterium]CAG0962523.1 hypothetical protein BURK2_00817 [Burkholderiales bacterium]
MTEEIIGSYQTPRDEAQVESLSLRFSPISIPIKQRWRNNGLSADFLADYVATFFPRVEDDPASETRRREISGAVKYIANELLENAMKYSAQSAGPPITILLQLDHEKIAFWETNTMDRAQGERFRQFIGELLQSDPDAFYLEQLERSATGEGSGLGFLTMINDYAARLAWQFSPAGPEAITVTTHVHLAI